MCRVGDALAERRLAAELLSSTCLARIPDPLGEALDRGLAIDPVVPPEMTVLLGKIDEGEKE